MPDHLQQGTAQIVGLFVESVFYGLYLDTFFRCIYVLIRSKHGWKRRHDINWGLVVVTLVLFVSGTINISLGLLRILQGFVQHIGLGLPWINIMKFTTVNLQATIGDGVLIYRCYRVWGRNWAIIILPSILWLGDLAIVIWSTWLNWSSMKSPLLFSGPIHAAFSTFWSITVVINIYATGMIVYRIWNARDDARTFMPTDSNAPSKKATPLDSILRIIVDSGLIYTLVSLTAFFSQLTNSNAIYITTAADIMAIGIAFNLINIRVANLKNYKQETTRAAHNGEGQMATQTWIVRPGVTESSESISAFESTARGSEIKDAEGSKTDADSVSAV